MLLLKHEECIKGPSIAKASVAMLPSLPFWGVTLGFQKSTVSSNYCTCGGLHFLSIFSRMFGKTTQGRASSDLTSIKHCDTFFLWGFVTIAKSEYLQMAKFCACN